MENSDQLPKILKLNLNKCELLPIHDCNLSVIHSIPVKTTVKYLGIQITKDVNQLTKLNIWGNLEKCKVHLNSWSQRDLSIIG